MDESVKTVQLLLALLTRETQSLYSLSSLHVTLYPLKGQQRLYFLKKLVAKMFYTAYVESVLTFSAGSAAQQKRRGVGLGK